MTDTSDLERKFWKAIEDDRTMMLGITGIPPRPMTALAEDKQAPLWFFSHSKAWLAQQPWVHGLQANSVESMYQYFDDVWLSDGGARRRKGRGV